ncbi:MAG: hypothetical protein DRJ42_12470 [Deltaproteobacteria bacterium]|nr:MAG: hypothetical protein DRJ42_12470 [Deltaproteobacteria bacterium]
MAVVARVVSAGKRFEVACPRAQLTIRRGTGGGLAEGIDDLAEIQHRPGHGAVPGSLGFLERLEGIIPGEVRHPVQNIAVEEPPGRRERRPIRAELANEAAARLILSLEQRLELGSRNEPTANERGAVLDCALKRTVGGANLRRQLSLIRRWGRQALQDEEGLGSCGCMRRRGRWHAAANAERDASRRSVALIRNQGRICGAQLR